jgi:hypothetical protein
MAMTPEQYLARAGELTTMAETATTPELRAEYQKLAKAWRELAKDAEAVRRGPGRWDRSSA